MGFDVTSNSYTGPPSQGMRDVIAEANLFVAAAGNSRADTDVDPFTIDLYRSSNGDSWPIRSLTVEPFCLCVWDNGGGDRMYVGRGHAQASGRGRIYRSNVNVDTGWAQVYNPGGAQTAWAFLALEPFDTYLYASTGTGFRYSGGYCCMGQYTPWRISASRP